MDNIKVMIIDEQPFFRAGVRQALSQQSDIEILDCAPDQNTLGLIEANIPDVALLGSDLAASSGLELARTITRHYPNTKVIVMSPDPNDEDLFEIIKTAAVACLSKNTIAQELVSTIRRARNGEYPINESITRPVVAMHVIKQFRDMESMGKAMEPIVAPLTKRETQILNHIAEGQSNKQVARILEISEQTIKNHVSSILRKLNANDRAHAVVLAIRHGWISADEE